MNGFGDGNCTLHTLSVGRTWTVRAAARGLARAHCELTAHLKCP